ncbi:MAG: hypothetical protein ACJAU6_002165 [Alphaproteobacteria bacterium]|jgi:hypothetical protein
MAAFEQLRANNPANTARAVNDKSHILNRLYKSPRRFYMLSVAHGTFYPDAILPKAIHKSKRMDAARN